MWTRRRRKKSEKNHRKKIFTFLWFIFIWRFQIWFPQFFIAAPQRHRSFVCVGVWVAQNERFSLYSRENHSNAIGRKFWKFSIVNSLLCVNGRKINLLQCESCAEPRLEPFNSLLGVREVYFLENHDQVIISAATAERNSKIFMLST